MVKPHRYAVESAGLSDIGRKRTMNQDALVHDDYLGLYSVADGMGGHQAGDVASRIVVATLVDCFSSSSGRKQGTYPVHGMDERLSDEANHLVSCIHQANTRVFEAASNDDSLKGMGSTVSCVFLTSNTAIAANVGDSPIYLIRDKTICPLSVSHTLYASLEEDGQAFQGAKNILTRAIGTARDVAVDSCEVPVFPDDAIVLCSDGLSNQVSLDEIQTLVQNESPSTACGRLVQLANDRGGPDNISVIVVRIVKPGSKDTWKSRLLKIMKRGLNTLKPSNKLL